ncbi:MAG: VanZ family protein [Oscillospiraceae bacterium]|jgi:glycopeptide antibiotics resistance protein|nr:VanZ family protein [Oscillospiraceae bacterium]
MYYLADYIIDSLPYMLCALPLLALFRFWAVRRMRKRGAKTTFAHELLLGLFLLLIVALLSQTVIPKFEFGNVPFGFAKDETDGGINLIPGLIFYDSVAEWQKLGSPFYFVTNLLGNIIMFAPLGFFPPLLFKVMPRKKVLLLAFSFSLFVELLQLPQARWTDVDDLWLNTLGGLLGYGLYQLFIKIFPKLKTRFFTTE